jgi:OmcA/MtrC family decaheme c-type cytochrome
MKRPMHCDVSRVALLGVACCALLACPGPSGQPCSVSDNGDGTATISCPDGTSVVVRNGTDGRNGTSCTVSANPDAGTRTITCSDGTSVTVLDGTNGADANAVVDFSTLSTVELAATELSVTVVGVTANPRPVVTFVVRDGKGKGVKSIPSANFSGISLMQLSRGDTSAGGNGLNNDTWVSLITNCATCTPSTETAGASSLLDQGTGAYVYTFQKDVTAVPGIAFDATTPHKLGLRLAASGNPFRPVDAVYEYIPATGANVTGQNDKVSTASCLECHMQWRANALNAGGTVPFHSGQRYEAQYCVVCHNDQRKYSGSSPSGNPVIAEPAIDASGNMTPPAGRTNIPVLRGQAVINLPVFVHKIHMGRELHLKGNYAGMGTEMNEVTFPQSPANCAKCHKNAALADNWKSKPSRRACGSCHDGVDFVTGANHPAGPFADDSLCGACHTPSLTATAHIPVAPIDPRNVFSTPDGGSSNTNAASLGVASNPPSGAIVLTYAMPDGGVTTAPLGDGGVNARVRFKLMDGAGSVVFNTFDAGVTDLMDNFVGSPSVYCAFTLPQDGIGAPADFNASVSGYVKNIWRGTAAGSGAGTMIGPDPNGFYTVTLTGVTIPPSARMLTCGVGYTYNLSSAQPLTQTNVPGYPYDTATKVGGLSIPPANVWQVAVGYTGRRGATSNRNPAGTGLIVSPAKCNNCHNTLGISPTFHAGQRNDGPSCSWCHTQNRTSSGWAAGSESFVHAIHGAGKRTVPFNWHALSEEEGYFRITFPGRPQQCEGCHNPGYYDFSAGWYATAGNVESRLPQTVATGTYNGLPALPDGGVNTNLWALSPYVIADTVYNYGSGYSFNAGTQVITEAAPTTLVNSPITNACFGCHDATASVWHYRANGGQVYEPRGAQPYVNKEQCLICHGPGKIAAIKDVHYK